MASESQSCINSYIDEYLTPTILGPSSPKTINHEVRFSRFLSSQKIRQAEEKASDWQTQLSIVLSKRTHDWQALGIPPPIVPNPDTPQVGITWSHPKYLEITGLEPIDSNFCEILNWLESLNGQDFLFPCAAFLKIIGATDIRITDGKGDEGIDLIGRITNGPTKSVVFWGQSKTKQSTPSTISRDTVLIDYSKYIGLPNTEIYRKYRKALGLDDSVDGLSPSYIFFTNSDFAFGARKSANDLGILLRCRRQIAFWLSFYSTSDKLKQTLIEIRPKLKNSLDHNITLDIPIDTSSV